jgi:hypothetical protein
MHAKLLRQSAILAMTMFFLIAVVLAFADTWMNEGPVGALPRRCSLQFPKWFGCALANHESLAGAMIGAAGTVFAGWIAWRAAIRTIEHQRRPSQQALTIILEFLRPILAMMVQVWRIAQHKPETDDIRMNGILLIRTIIPNEDAINNLNRNIGQYAAFIDPSRTQALSAVLRTLEGIVSRVPYPQAEYSQLWLYEIQSRLTLLARYVEALDLESAKIFEGLVRTKFDDQLEAEHI